jgi:hypothetical protein
MPIMSYTSRSCQLAVGQMSLTVGTSTILRHGGAHAEVLVMAVAVELIHHLKTRLPAHVIEAGDIHEVVEGQFVAAVFQQRLRTWRA